MRLLPAHELISSPRERQLLDNYAQITHIMHKNTVLDLSQSYGRNGPPPNKHADTNPKKGLARDFL